MGQRTLSDRPVASGGAEGACVPPLFERSVNPISTRGGTLSPPSTMCPPGFSDLATALNYVIEYSGICLPMCMSIGFKINARRSHPTICLQIKMQVIFEMPKLPLLAKLVRRHTAVLLPEPAHITQRPEFENILKKI